MDIHVGEIDDIRVVRIEGMIDTVTAADVEATLTGLISGGTDRLLLNLEKLDYINSIGLRVILMVAKQLKHQSGELRICCLTDPVKEVFELTGFSNILCVLPTEPEALNDF